MRTNKIKCILIGIIVIFMLNSCYVIKAAETREDLIKEIKLISKENKVWFEIQAGEIPLNELEFSLWMNLNNNEWKEVQEYQETIQEYIMQDPGIYNFQVNIRLKDNKEKEQKKWIGSITKEAKMVQNIKIINSTQYIDKGETVFLDIEKEAKFNLEAAIYIKIDNGDWIQLKGYSEENLNGFKLDGYGDTHIQLNFRDKDKKYLEQKIYIGQVRVKLKEKIIDNISLTPSRLVFKVGEKISVTPVSENNQENEYEYKILTRYNDENWKEVGGYQKLPLSEIKLERPGIFNVCLEVKDPRDSSKYQITIGKQIAVAEFNKENIENLLRILVSNYSFFEYDNEQIYEVFSKELDVISKIFISQYYNQNLDELIKELDKIIPISNKDNINKEKVIVFNNAQGMLKKLDLTNNTILFNKQLINLNLKDYSTIYKVIQELNNSPDVVKVAGIFTHLIYNHYRYNDIPGGNEMHNEFFSIDGHCLQQSNFLYQMLKNAGYGVRKISAKTGNYGGHAVVELKNDNKIYTLDATLNLVYNEEVEKLKSTIKPIVLPQVFNRYYTWENDMWDHTEEVYIWETSEKWN